MLQAKTRGEVLHWELKFIDFQRGMFLYQGLKMILLQLPLLQLQATIQIKVVLRRIAFRFDWGKGRGILYASAC